MSDTCLLISLMSYASLVYPYILQGDLIRYVAGAGGTFLIVNTLLAGWLARRRIRVERPDWRQMAREILASLRTVVIFSLVGLAIALSERLGWLAIYGDPLDRGLPYLVFNLLVLIVAHDAWFYWSHKIMHRPGLFRWFHRLHHRSHNPSPWTSYAFDASEALVNAIYLPLALLLMPTSLLAAFLFTAHMMLRNAVGHCGYEIFPARPNGRPLFDWLTTVTHHDLHHARPRYNFGLYFTWWDRLMGTEDPTYLTAFAQAAGKADKRRPQVTPQLPAPAAKG
ncbi:sterol desaturase family protein [Mesorhizobium sp. B2-9-1]|uniref:sterol desaturase family protein n=1 Tax=Mesorhizobium sp. B2-9-1 TaxID=2589898 RepID=UPI00112C4D6A|nr:sterol desaturase family protein [Mesorhizobium sp. B2-9-1]TPI49784.1 sterol desaturase family protein [Mesorhizobium sp. B2-9-1]